MVRIFNFRYIYESYMLFILLLIFAGCKSCIKYDSALEIKNKSDYDLKIVFAGEMKDSILRLTQVSFYNWDYQNRYSPGSLDNSDFERLYRELQDSSEFESQLDYLIDSANIYFFGFWLIPVETGFSHPMEDIILVKNGENLIYELDSTYYTDKPRSFYRHMIINNWFEIPLPTKSKLTIKDDNLPSWFILNFFPGNDEIKIMYQDVVIKKITQENFYDIKQRKKFLDGRVYFKIKINDNIVEEKIKQQNRK